MHISKVPVKCSCDPNICEDSNLGISKIWHFPITQDPLSGRKQISGHRAPQLAAQVCNVDNTDVSHVICMTFLLYTRTANAQASHIHSQLMPVVITLLNAYAISVLVKVIIGECHLGAIAHKRAAVSVLWRVMWTVCTRGTMVKWSYRNMNPDTFADIIQDRTSTAHVIASIANRSLFRNNGERWDLLYRY